MELSESQYQQIAHCLPRQRGNVRLSNLQVLNAILYVAKHDCTWRSLPPRFGPWHTVYTRMMRWAKSGVLDRVFEQLQHLQIIQIKIEIVQVKIEAMPLDSTVIEIHTDGTGALRKTAPKLLASRAADGPPKFIWLPRMNAVP
jgi:transposase